MKYTNRKGFIGVRPDGSLILQSCAYTATDSRNWICGNLRKRDEIKSWERFRLEGYRVIKCEIAPFTRDGGAET